MFEIVHRYTRAVLYRSESAADLRGAVLDAVRSDADLSCANLSRANLSDANLRDADLSDADLSDANLSRANLRDANLIRANLRDADLSDADLSRANLSDADLSRANLSDADLSDADLSRANLSDEYITKAKADVFAVLDAAPNEVPGLLQAIVAGNVNGSCYEGTCACLLGTIANVRGCSYLDLGIKPNGARPAEQWFMSIKPGHVPKLNRHALFVQLWITEWQLAQVSK